MTGIKRTIEDSVTPDQPAYSQDFFDFFSKFKLQKYITVIKMTQIITKSHLQKHTLREYVYTYIYTQWMLELTRSLLSPCMSMATFDLLWRTM